MQPDTKILLIIILILIIFTWNNNLDSQVISLNPVIKSALIPGWGQLSIDRSYGIGLLASEVLLWSSFIYNANEQNLKDRESYEFALKYAHINPGEYSSQYFRDLSKYDSSGFEAGGYNAMVRQTAIDLYPDDQFAQQVYINDNSISDQLSWQWDNFQLRKNYSTMRKDILEYKDRVQVLTGVIMANHLISTIDILRLRPHWKKIKPQVQYYRNSPSFFVTIEL